MKTRIWRITVSISDTPVEGESYKEITDIVKHIDSSPEAGLDIKAVDWEDYGLQD